MCKKTQKNIKKGQLISLESTTYPGTTESFILPMINQNGYKVSKEFFLVYSSERVSPELKTKKKIIKFHLTNTPKVCGGYSRNCLKLGENLYKNITTKIIKAKDLKSAEASKMLENVYRSVNIALVNELKMFFKEDKYRY